MSPRLILRPLDGWPYPVTTARKSPTFRSGWGDTRGLLLREVENLGATLAVVELDVPPGAVRRDGELRADTRPGDFPGVRVSFESRHGPLSYATDRYEWLWSGAPMRDWQANVRAVALSLEALRAVDRHGVTRAGEQYTGWKALPPGTGQVTAGQAGAAVVRAADTAMTRERAARLIADLTGFQNPGEWAEVLLMGDEDSAALLRQYWRAIVRRLHPDRGGSPELFAQATAAYAALRGES